MSRHLEDGRRHIVKILVPGDMIGVDALFTGRADCEVEALTDVTGSLYGVQSVRALIEADPETIQEVGEFMHHELILAYDQLTNLGTRSALERVAWFLLDLFDRLREQGLVENSTCEMPLRQSVIADVLGLAPANVSRILRSLREQGLVSVRQGRMSIIDRAKLKAVAQRTDI